MQTTTSFSTTYPSTCRKLSIRKKLGLRTNFHSQGQTAKFLWAAWVSKTETSRKSTSWGDRFRICRSRVNSRRQDSKYSQSKIASPVRMGSTLGSPFQASSLSLGKVASWIRSQVLAAAALLKALISKIGLTRTCTPPMTQPSVSLKSAQCTQDNTRIKDLRMPTRWVKKKWRLTVCSTKTLCRQRKSFQQFWAWATNRTTCTSTMKGTQYLLPTRLKTMSSKTNK